MGLGVLRKTDRGIEYELNPQASSSIYDETAAPDAACGEVMKVSTKRRAIKEVLVNYISLIIPSDHSSSTRIRKSAQFGGSDAVRSFFLWESEVAIIEDSSGCCSTT